MPWGTDIEIKGWITPSSANRFAAILNATPSVKVIRIQTLGGRIPEAQHIAELIHSRKLITYVETQCASAGIIILTAGRERVARENAQIGLHSASILGVKSNGPESTLLNAGFITALHEVGADEMFIKRAIETPPASMWWPDIKELISEGVLTRSVSKFGEGFGEGTDELAKSTPKEIRRSVLEESGSMSRAFKALAKLEPDRFEASVESASRSIQKGSDPLGAMKDFLSLYSETTSRRFARASDNAMHQWAIVNLKLLRDNSEIAPRNTLLRVVMDNEARSWTGPTVFAKLPNYPEQDSDEFMTLLLASDLAASTPQIIATETAEGKAVLRSIIHDKADAELCSRFGEVRSFNESETKQGCAIMLRYFSAVLELPIDKQGQAMRFLNHGGD